MGKEIEKKIEFESRPMEPGYIEVITGCMFSGKTDELIRRIRRALFAKKKVQVFKPSVDKRRGESSINTFNGDKIPAVSVKSSREILKLLKSDTDWVAVDEAQFFDDELPEVCDQLARKGKRVIVAGLSADFRNEPFGPMDALMRDAEKLTRLTAHCEVCGGIASRTQRIINGKPANYDDPVVLVGAEESYEARCRLHHEVPGRLKKGEKRE